MTLHLNEIRRLELDDGTEFRCGDGISLLLCDVWVNTTIEAYNGEYYAVGLPGLKLEGLTAKELGGRRW